MFPELEHQLNYIRYANADFTQSVTEFSKYEDNHVVAKSDVYIDDSELNQYVIDVLEMKLCGIVDKEDIKEIKRLIESNFDVDWYKRTLRLIDAEYEIMAHNADPDVIEKSKRTLGQMEAVLGNDNTINSLVCDILDHYENYREDLLTGKAMIVA